MIADPRVSVVVPVHRVPRPFLADCLASLAAQTDRDFEVVIVDDGSGARDRAALEAEAARALDGVETRFVMRARRGGPAAARNDGAEAARGEYLMWVDADDVAEPRLVESVRAALRAAPALVYTHHVDVEADGRTLLRERDKRPYHALLRRHFGTADDPLIHAAWVSHCTTVRRSDFEAVGGYRTDLRYGEELEVVVKVTERRGPEQVALISEPLYRYRANPGSIVRQADLYRQVNEARLHIVMEAARRRGLEPVKAERLGRAAQTGVPQFGLYDEWGARLEASWFDYEALAIRPERFEA